ncbi:membrane progesterone receptor epsilon [Chiloscyllium plagiosum]|uniref:membrane progesterone receptor epsilon n=1 Tax=Chiloscyllium plagiosum TaxID=36176 RepID=UPI001CB81CAA|nr:membrane progesterone receptor epsilon [Chiloscyllium plagiosum]
MYQRRGIDFLACEEIPREMRECFIVSRYRRPNSTVTECVYSVLQPTNETFNFWTHYMPLLFFLYRFHQILFKNEELCYDHPFLLPMWCFAFGVSIIFAESCAAHLFNSLSQQLRQIFYYMDYVAFNLYGFGSAIACYYYIFPLLTVMNPMLLEGNGLCTEYSHVVKFYSAFCIPGTFLLLVICTIAICKTYIDWAQHRYIIRAIVFLIPINVSVPILIDIFYFDLPLKNPHVFFYFWRQRTWLLLAIMFNVSRIPERFWPGLFDVIGQSHQWFHLFSFLTVNDQLCYLEYGFNIFVESPPMIPKFADTMGAMFLLLLSFLLVIKGLAKQSPVYIYN